MHEKCITVAIHGAKDKKGVKKLGVIGWFWEWVKKTPGTL